MRKPPEIFSPQHHGKSHKFKRVQNKTQGVSFAQYTNSRASVGGMGNDSSEEYDIYTNAGYNTRRGYINLEFDSATPPMKMTENQKDEHMIGVILAEQFSLK